MYTAHNIYIFSSSLLKKIVLSVMLLALIACGHHDDSTLSGNAIKGVITNGIITAYLIEPHKEHTLLGQARTDHAGHYEMNIPKLKREALVLLELTTDTSTTMRCDVAGGCFYPDTSNRSNTLFVEFGEELPLPAHFKLVGFKQGNQPESTFISPLSHVIYTTASSLPGGLSKTNLNTALSRTIQIFDLDADLLNAKLPDLTALSHLDNLSNQQLKLGVLSSAFYTTALSENWSSGQVGLEQLPLETIFRHTAHTADALSQQLAAEQSPYSQALSEINSEADAMVQTFESKQLVIIQQPVSLSVNESQGFSLQVQATGDGALSYQWYKNNLVIPSANAASYNVSAANLGHTGSYSVRITDNGSQITSLNAFVSVKKSITPIVITQQPQALNLTAGDPIQLSVEVSGDGPFDYQWQKEGSLLLDETNSTLLIHDSAPANSGAYRVTISNGISEASSRFVDVIINAAALPVSIQQQPQDMVLIQGSSAHFQVDASGGGYITYQWRKNSINLPNAYSNQLAISQAEMEDAGNYDVVITNSRGSLYSDVATLSILPSETPISITLQPVSKSAFLTDSIRLSVAAIGGDELNYQWYFNGEAILGENYAELYIESVALEHEGSYTVVVTNTHSSEESLAAFISVKEKPSVQLSWDIPSYREDGSQLDMSEISGYVLEYGDSPSGITEKHRINDAYTTQYTLPNVDINTLYARIATIDSSGLQGNFSRWTNISVK